MNLQDEIKALKERIAELEVQVEKEQAFPQDGDTYSYINTYGGVESDIWEGHFAERNMVKIGNFFKTEEEAEFVAEKLRVEAELRKFSRPFESMTDNFIIVFDRETYKLGVKAVIFSDIQGAIYFDTTTVAEEAIETVGKERIKKYIFGVRE